MHTEVCKKVCIWIWTSINPYAYFLRRLQIYFFHVSKSMLFGTTEYGIKFIAAFIFFLIVKACFLVLNFRLLIFVMEGLDKGIYNLYLGIR